MSLSKTAGLIYWLAYIYDCMIDLIYKYSTRYDYFLIVPEIKMIKIHKFD